MPGIGEYFSVPHVRCQMIDKGNKLGRNLNQASNIPVTDNLPDLALPGPDETL